MSGEARIGSMIGGRFEDFCGPVAYRGKEGCQNVTCTRHRDVTDRCFGWHCSHCHGPASYQGHLSSGRYQDGEYRPFADGTPRLSCQPGYLDAALAPVQADDGSSTAETGGEARLDQEQSG